VKEIKDEVLRQDREEPQLIQAIADRAGVEPTDIRVKFGQRIVHGTLASGEVRRELDGDRLEHLDNAIQQPPTADPSAYERKVPAMEITAGDVVLFRQERDGTVTRNGLDAAKDAVIKPVAVAPVQSPPEAIAVPQTSEQKMSPQQKTTTVLDIADRLANPIPDSPPIEQTTQVAGLVIRTNGSVTVVSDNEGLVVRSDDPHMAISTEPDKAQVEALQAVDQPLLPRSEIVVVPASQTQSGAIAVFNRQVASIQDPTTRQFCENIGQDMQRQAEVAQVEQSGQREFSQKVIQAKAAFSSLKEELVGDVKSSLKNVGNFLSARADAIMNQTMAQSAYKLFNRGAERTDEESYRQGNYEVKRTAPDQFLVSDQDGALLSFRISSQGAVKLTGKSDRLSRDDYEAFRSFRRDETIPQGGSAAEKLHRNFSLAAAKTARDFLDATNLSSWDAKDGNYRIEVGERNSLTVTAKDGRGVILEQQGKSIVSRLTPADFEKFAATQQQLDQSASPSKSKSGSQR
jgi:hypothetical protein